MISAWAAVTTAAWLGILTSISPCPLATNIAAVSYLVRRMGSRGSAVAGALAYAAGRVAAYLAIGLVLVAGLAAAPALSDFLQSAIAPFLGPVLILVGLLLLGWIPLPLEFGFHNAALAGRLAALGLFGEFLLGFLFALSFCPVSAALFFGALLPLALGSSVPLALVAAYGIGTALPVGIIAVLIAIGAAAVSGLIAGIERWQAHLRQFTAWVIIALGVWLTLGSSLGLFQPPVGFSARVALPQIQES